MNWKAAVGLCALTTVGTISAAAQERLGDVGETLKLDRGAAEGVVIDQNTVPPSRQIGTTQSDGTILQGVVEDGIVQTQVLIGLLVDARQGGLFTDPEWRGQINEAGMRIEIAQQDLRSAWGPGRYEPAFELAEQAMELAAASALEVREGIERNRLRITEPLEQLNEGVDLLEESLKSIRFNLREERSQAPAPLLDSTATAAAARDLCSRKYAARSEKWTECIDQQNAAVSSINLRNSLGSGLEETDFNKIRNACRFEWPDNFFFQNRCEVERVARRARQ